LKRSIGMKIRGWGIQNSQFKSYHMNHMINLLYTSHDVSFDKVNKDETSWQSDRRKGWEEGKEQKLRAQDVNPSVVVMGSYGSWVIAILYVIVDHEGTRVSNHSKNTKHLHFLCFPVFSSNIHVAHASRVSGMQCKAKHVISKNAETA
jgi:hypothetical protein